MSGLDLPEYFDLLCRTFHAAPVIQHVPQVMRIERAGEVQIELANDPRFRHTGGAIHGGIIALLLDNAGYFACASDSEGHWVVTSEMKVNFLESVNEGDLLAIGRVLRKGRHLMHAEMFAQGSDGKKVASALGTYAVMPLKFRGLGRPDPPRS